MSDDYSMSKLMRKFQSAHLEHLPHDVPPERIAQSVCAFLNTSGGTVLVGPGPDNESIGHRMLEVESALHRLIRPPALWSVVEDVTDGACQFTVDVPAGRDRPYTVESKIFVRRGPQTTLAGPEEIRRLVENTFAGGERWERKLLPGAGIEKLNENLIRTTAEEAQRQRNYRFSDTANIECILFDLALFREQAITHAAEVLFGLKPAIQFPQVRVRVAVYLNDKGSNFVDNRQFEEAAIPMLEEVFGTIRKHMPVAGTFGSGLRRTDRPQFPEAAVREGLVNAFAHRDYANFSGGLSVDLYPDRLVIWNSGSLPEGIKIGDLKREHPSMPRNPDIAHVFFLCGFMERVGRGTQKIVAECAEAGLPAPQWKSDQTGVTLTFRTKGKAARILNLRERKLLDELRSDETVRLPEYCARLAISERQGRRDLGDLVENGWMNREGEGPATIFRRTQKQWQAAIPGQIRPE